MIHETQPPRDEIAARLRDLDRQGGGMARLAHICAGLLLVAFSLGSLLSISHAAFITFLARWDAGTFDIPDGISLVVNVLLVLAADVALLYAASVLRVLYAAQAPAYERRVHLWAMVGASVLEATTYLYLAWVFDRPTGLFLWAIVIGRALAAPLFAAYLSMARALPVGPRDVAYQAALASGKGVVHDVATLAADPSAPLERKVRIYRASALMSPHDLARFNNIVEAVSVPDEVPAIIREDFPPLPPPTPDGPSSRPVRESAAEDMAQPGEWTIVPRRRRQVRAVRGKAPGKMSDEELETVGMALLDANPKLSRTALRERLGKRYEVADRVWTRWKNAANRAAVAE